jgi:formylglycine-generating enzyme required for sulfatase activity
MTDSDNPGGEQITREDAAHQGCCAPPAERGRRFEDAKVAGRDPRGDSDSFQSHSFQPGPSEADHSGAEFDMVALPGGAFLMGTDYENAFPDDGEGPVRRVTLSPFLLDRHTVSNRRFARFVEATHYVTEAERFGWSFVFWAQIPKDSFDRLVTDTVAAAPWWCQVPGAWW